MKLSAAIFIITIFFSFGKCNTLKSTTVVKADAQTIYTYQSPSADGTGKVYMGREIAQVMGAAGSAWLERANRQQEENTKLAIEKMNLSPNDVVADIGAGTGYYTFQIAQKVPKGKVYAVEIQDEMIQYLKDRVKQSNIKNVVAIKGSEQSPDLPDSSVDLALMVDVYHELAYPHEMLQAISKSLKKRGKLLLLEYKAEDPAVAIKPLHKMSIVQANKELEANGFKLFYKGDFLPIQHFLLYEKQ